jgi:hypothetical protein
MAKKNTVTVVVESDHLWRMQKASEFIAEAVDQICDSGNEDLPGRAASGFADVLRWVARDLEQLQKGTSQAAKVRWPMKRAATQKLNQKEDLLDLALGGGGIGGMKPIKWPRNMSKTMPKI